MEKCTRVDSAYIPINISLASTGFLQFSIVYFVCHYLLDVKYKSYPGL